MVYFDCENTAHESLICDINSHTRNRNGAMIQLYLHALRIEIKHYIVSDINIVI